MNEILIPGAWENLGHGAVRLTAERYNEVALRLNIQICVPSASASISVSLTLAGHDTYTLAEQIGRLYEDRQGQAILHSDWPNASLNFRWCDEVRCMAELNGCLVQGLSIDDELWKFEIQVRHFRFEAFYLQRLATTLKNMLVEYGFTFQN
jgi:hypothetical protein